MKKFLKFLGMFTCLVSLPALGQDTVNNKNCNYAKDPCWIKMMDDPKVNYYEAQKAFKEFWKARGGEPFVKEDMNSRNKYNAKKRSRSEEKEDAERQKYAIEYKRFLQWSKEVEPYVQSDGSILSPEERIRIYEEQRK